VAARSVSQYWSAAWADRQLRRSCRGFALIRGAADRYRAARSDLLLRLGPGNVKSKAPSLASTEARLIGRGSWSAERPAGSVVTASPAICRPLRPNPAARA